MNSSRVAARPPGAIRGKGWPILRSLLLGLVALAVSACQSLVPAGLASQASSASVKGAGYAAADTRPPGRLKLVIKWPTLEEQRERGYRSQLIPDSAATLYITVKDGTDDHVAPFTVTRTAGPTTSVVKEMRARNNLAVEVKAYPTSPNENTRIALGNATVNIYSSADTNATITLAPDYVPAISSIDYNAAAVGQSIILTGTNFRKTWAAAPKVWFNGTVSGGVPSGTEGNVTASTDTSITVTVPTGATTGNLVVEADNVPSSSTANLYVFASQSSLAMTADSVTINGHTTGSDGLVAGMTYYASTHDYTLVATFALKTGETLTSTWTNPPAPTWASANPANTISNQTGPTVASSTTTTVGRLQAASSNPGGASNGNITATIGQVTSNAILAQPVGVDSITLSPSSVTINAMPPNGTPVGSNYTSLTTATITATVNSTLPFNDGVTWSLGTPLVSTAQNTGQVTVKTSDGAAAGSATVTATSVTNNAITAQRTVTITDNGDLGLTIN